MALARSYLQLKHLRVMRRGHAAYDQKFHEGVNIIRGDNGSGKSTIADFIFFALGGEYDDWKDAASQCDEVQAEVETPRGSLVLRRNTVSKLEPAHVFLVLWNRLWKARWMAGRGFLFTGQKEARKAFPK